MSEALEDGRLRDVYREADTGEANSVLKSMAGGAAGTPVTDAGKTDLGSASEGSFKEGGGFTTRLFGVAAFSATATGDANKKAASLPALFTFTLNLRTGFVDSALRTVAAGASEAAGSRCEKNADCTVFCQPRVAWWCQSSSAAASSILGASSSASDGLGTRCNARSPPNILPGLESGASNERCVPSSGIAPMYSHSPRTILMLSRYSRHDSRPPRMSVSSTDDDTRGIS
jgi:hypothetical protein